MEQVLTSGQDRVEQPSVTLPAGGCAAVAADGAAGMQARADGPPPDDLGAPAVTEQAVGMVMALGRLSADQARSVLTRVSQRANITPGRAAGLLTAWAFSGELNLGIRIALEEAIRERRRPGRPPSPAE